MTNLVAPLAGAWIEIQHGINYMLLVIVAPLAGAWIEILTDAVKNAMVECRSPCGSVD